MPIPQKFLIEIPQAPMIQPGMVLKIPAVLSPFIPLALMSCATNEMPRPPDETMAAISGTSIQVLQRGHSVYMLKCGECHQHMMPEDVSRADWHIVVPGMAWNAGIPEADEDAVLKYILAAKKAEQTQP